MIRVEGHKHLYRDENTGAIVNCDTTGYMRYKKMRNKKLTENSPIELSWTNDQGITFEKEISLDEKYLFSIFDNLFSSYSFLD